MRRRRPLLGFGLAASSAMARLTLDIHAAVSILAITPRSRNRLIQYHTGSPRHLTKRGTGSQAIIGRGCYVCQG